MKYSALLLLLVLAISQPTEDLVENPPGMNGSSKIYSGYLDTLSPTRKLHYVLVESESNPDKDPLVLWLNGGPGCSSLLGFLQQIGSYTIESTTYINGSNLTRNQYGWAKVANILYLESPAGVRFSTNTEQNYQHTDVTTANDAYAAIKFFFEGKGAKWLKNPFLITGESYAGKYIPDLVVKILDNNPSFYINITGIMVGNGVMNFEDHSLQKSSIEYMNTHNFISPPMMGMYKESCLVDFWSPRCNLFKMEFNAARARLNRYNVYEVCKTGSSEASMLLNKLEQKEPGCMLFNSVAQVPECPSEEGMIQYLNANRQAYNIKQNITWAPCTSLHYEVNPTGSLAEYRRIQSNGKVNVWLYNGDADDVVPLPDTFKNLPKVGLYSTSAWTPWMVGQNHAGFYQYFSESFMLATVKGAGHMVPQNKRKAAYQMFYNFINGRTINTPV